MKIVEYVKEFRAIKRTGKKSLGHSTKEALCQYELEPSEHI